MIVAGSTSYYSWDMYFVLKLLLIPMQFVAVDVEEGSRQYDILHMMRHYRHIKITEQPGMITEIASTNQGFRFYWFLVNIGYGTKETEDQGKEWIARLEKQFINSKKHE